MKTDGLNISRRNVLRLGGGIMALAGSAPFSALMAAPANLADLPYSVNIVNTSSNATLVLQALLDQLLLQRVSVRESRPPQPPHLEPAHRFW